MSEIFILKVMIVSGSLTLLQMTTKRGNRFYINLSSKRINTQKTVQVCTDSCFSCYSINHCISLIYFNLQIQFFFFEMQFAKIQFLLNCFAFIFQKYLINYFYNKLYRYIFTPIFRIDTYSYISFFFFPMICSQ